MGGLPGERRPMLRDTGRSARAPERVHAKGLVLSQRTGLPEYPGRMQKEGRPVFHFTKKSVRELQAVLVLLSRTRRKGIRSNDRGRLQGQRWSGLQLPRRG